MVNCLFSKSLRKIQFPCFIVCNREKHIANLLILFYHPLCVCVFKPKFFYGPAFCWYLDYFFFCIHPSVPMLKVWLANAVCLLYFCALFLWLSICLSLNLYAARILEIWQGQLAHYSFWIFLYLTMRTKSIIHVVAVKSYIIAVKKRVILLT